MSRKNGVKITNFRFSISNQSLTLPHQGDLPVLFACINPPPFTIHSQDRISSLRACRRHARTHMCCGCFWLCLALCLPLSVPASDRLSLADWQDISGAALRAIQPAHTQLGAGNQKQGPPVPYILRRPTCSCQRPPPMTSVPPLLHWRAWRIVDRIGYGPLFPHQ